VLRHFNFLGGKKGDDVVDEYARCRLLALPSRHEGFGMVVLESLASGRPAAITNFEGSHWFTSSGACLVSRRGDSKQLSDNLNRILEDDEMTDEMSRSGQKFAEQFDWAQIAARHEKIYVKTLNPGLL